MDIDITPIHDKLIDFYRDLRSDYYAELEAGGATDLYDLKEEIYTAGYLIEVLRRKQNVHDLPYSDFKIYDEIAFITQDLKYIVGMLSVLRPYINNPLQEERTYAQTLEDHLYLRYSSFGYQSVYSFWDRVGDLLYLYFPTGLKQRSVYLGLVLDKIPEPYKATREYQALLGFYNDKIKQILETRHEIVHHFMLKSSHRWLHVEHRDNPLKLKQHFDEKYGYRDDLRQQLLNCLEGYRLMVTLVDVLPNKVKE